MGFDSSIGSKTHIWAKRFSFTARVIAPPILLTVRKRRAKTRLGGAGPWEYIYGDAPVPGGGSASLDGGPGLIESSVNPIFSRRDTPSAFQWRIRNLHYPSEVFQVAVDAAERKIVVRTTIKK